MKWLLVPVGLLALAIVSMLIVGMFLPRDHMASRNVHLKAAPDVVFRLIADFASLPTWRPEVTSVELLPARDGKTSFREKGRQGPMTYVVEELTPPNTLVTRIVDNSSFGGTWTFEVTPDSGGCKISITERGEVYNPLFRTMSRLFFSQIATMEGYLRDLGKKLGEDVVPQA